MKTSSETLRELYGLRSPGVVTVAGDSKDTKDGCDASLDGFSLVSEKCSSKTADPARILKQNKVLSKPQQWL